MRLASYFLLRRNRINAAVQPDQNWGRVCSRCKFLQRGMQGRSPRTFDGSFE